MNKVYLAPKASVSRYHIRSCHMLTKSKIVFKKCWWKKPIPGNTQQWKFSLQNQMQEVLCQQCQYLFSSLRASLATGTQDLSISKTVQNIRQITFHLRSKIRSKSFGKSFKLLRTENAIVHKPFVQNADSEVIFIDPCPEICISKLANFHWTLAEAGRNFHGNFLRLDRCAFFGIWGLRVGPSRLHRQTYVEGTMCSSPTRTPPFAQTALAQGVLSKRKTAEEGTKTGGCVTVAFLWWKMPCSQWKTCCYRYHIRSCHMLPKSKIVFKKCWWNKPIPGKT